MDIVEKLTEVQDILIGLKNPDEYRGVNANRLKELDIDYAVDILEDVNEAVEFLKYRLEEKENEELV